MIKNYFKIAFRNLVRHKGFSLINIIGLAIGMSAFMLIFMYVRFELSYDNFHAKGDNIYRLNVDLKSANDVMKGAESTMPMGPAIKADFPEVVEQTRVMSDWVVVSVNNHIFKEKRLFYAEPSFFKVFSFPLIKGDAESLKNPFTVILNESTAKKYFGSADPVGKTLLFDNKFPTLVTGVVKDAPVNSQFQFDLLFSVASLEKVAPGRLENWGNFGNYTFLLLRNGYDAKKLEAKFPAFLKNHISEENRKGGQDYALFLKPLKENYMDTREGLEQGNMSNVYIFSVVALFILLIAAVNFINLTTARATERAKEVGVRKVIGAARNQLTFQFLGESVIICLISFFVATALIGFSLPVFNQLAGKTISQSIFAGNDIFTLLGIAIVIGLAAGIYPALALSGFKPIVILKGRFSASSGGILLRRSLVVFQFTTSIVLIVGTLVVYNQLRYMRNQPLGFSKDQMLTIDFGGDDKITKNYEDIKTRFKALPGVLSATVSHGLPGRGGANAHSEFENRQGDMQPLNINMYDVDYDFIPVYDMKIIAGRTFARGFGTDTTQSVVINEATAKILGYKSPNDAIGKKFDQWGRKGQIIGVVKDFHYRSLQTGVEPLNMRFNPGNSRFLTLKIANQNIPATIASIESKWKTIAPQIPLEYSFVNQQFNKQYAGEERFGTLFLYFSVLAIFISCLGLLGLASYSTLQRTREIGIRKVLGASVFSITNMLSKEFLQLVLIAAVIAFPIAWFGMNKWMQGFAYKAGIGWWIFAVSGMLAMLIAITTVSFQSVKAALANPVKSLRSE